MNPYKSNSAQDIVYIDHTTSGVCASISQSSADPASLPNLMQGLVVFTIPKVETINDALQPESAERENTEI